MPPNGLDILEHMIYPGRVIVIGRDVTGGHDVVVYAITGRSRSSQARRLVFDGGGTVRTEVTDAGQLAGGNEKLLIYNCIRTFPGGLAVSNGAQTDLIWETALRLAKETPPPPFGEGLPKGTPIPPAARILQLALERPHVISGVDVTRYEPDAPAYTPRISGCLAGDAALAIVRRLPDGHAERTCFAVSLKPGQGKLLATYRGECRDPLPAFTGPPLDVTLSGRGAEEVSRDVYQALGPKAGEEDVRVAVATLFRHRGKEKPIVSIINRADHGG